MTTGTLLAQNWPSRKPEPRGIESRKSQTLWICSHACMAFFPAPPELEIGCFRGNPLSEQLADFTADLDWQHTDVLARKCAQLSHNKGYKYFALGNNGVCSSGANAKTEYFKNGGARLSDCLNGVGNKKSIFAYSLGKAIVAPIVW